MSTGQLEQRIICLLEKHDGFIEAQSVLEGHFAALLKVKSKKNSKSHHLRPIRRLLQKMERQGKIVIGGSDRVMRTATLVKREVVSPVSEVIESENEEMHVQEGTVSEIEAATVQPEVIPTAAITKATELPEHELLTVVVLECHKVSDDEGLIKGSVANLLQENLGCPPKTANRWVGKLKDLGLLQIVARGRRPVWRVDKQVNEVTPEMLAALPAPTSKTAKTSTAKKSQPATSRAKAKAELGNVKGDAHDEAPDALSTSRIELLLGAAVEEIKRLRVLEDQFRNGLKETEDLRTENARLRAELEAIGRIGDDLEKMLQADLVH